MYILGINCGHDASAALFNDGKLIAYCKEERLTRKKQDAGKPLRQKSIEEVINIAGISRKDIDVVALDRGRFPARCFIKSSNNKKLLWKKIIGRSNRLIGEMQRLDEHDEFAIVNKDKILDYLGVSSNTQIKFYNHHYSHSIGSYYYSGWDKDAVHLAVDAGGDYICHAAYSFTEDSAECIYGGDTFIFNKNYNFASSIGIAYSLITELLGYKANRHEGKITGLAAYGKPVVGEKILENFKLNEDINVTSPFKSTNELKEFLKDLVKNNSREDIAASIQFALEKHIVEMIKALYAIKPFKKIGLSGGVFANVRLNQSIAELDFIDELFVMPPMGDEGLSVGNAIAAYIDIKGFNKAGFAELDNVYFGKKYYSNELETVAKKYNCNIKSLDNPAESAASLLANNKIGAIFSERMEMGPRALGARSIIANPSKNELNDTLNQRLNRTEFMPFAPYVREDEARTVFDISNITERCCRFMTITANVYDEWKDKIPAVVHVDGTARPQIIDRQTNPLYFDILGFFKEQTGLPCLVNTSFNAHEEPIINTPEEAIKTLIDKRIDFLVTDSCIITNK